MFKQALKTTNNSIILAVPLIIFIKILDIYSSFSLYRADTAAKFLLAFITMILMSGVFAAAYFYLVKRVIEISKKIYIIDNDRFKETSGLFKELPEGISKYFLPFTGMNLIFFGIQLILTPFVYILGIKLFGHLRADLLDGIKTVALDSTAAQAFVDGLSNADLLYFAKWSLFLVLITFTVLYILILWIPETIYKNRNPLISLFTSIKKVFIDFMGTLKTYISVCLLGILLFIIMSIAFINPFTYLIANVIQYYFYLYISILIFLYYDKKYNTEEISTENEEE